MFALTVALGLRYLGVLLMGSLIIIPAATAKRVSRSLNQMLWTAAALAVVVTVFGSAVAMWIHRATGPIIVTLAACGLFERRVRRLHDGDIADRSIAADNCVEDNSPFDSRRAEGGGIDRFDFLDQYEVLARRQADWPCRRPNRLFHQL